MNQVLDRQRHALFHLSWRGAWHGGRDVQHGNQNLRLFFAGNDGDREDSEGQRRGNKERRQLGVEERLCQAPGDSKILRHGRTPVLDSIRFPASSRSDGASTSFSPAETPERTSTRSPCGAPKVR